MFTRRTTCSKSDHENNTSQVLVELRKFVESIEFVESVVRRRRTRGNERTDVPERRARVTRAKTVDATRRPRDENSKIARFRNIGT